MQISGIVQNIFPSIKHPKYSCLYIWDDNKKKTFFQSISNDRIIDLNVKEGSDITKVIQDGIKNFHKSSCDKKDVIRLQKMKVISDAKLNSDFSKRAPKEIVEREIQKNKDITNKLNLYNID